MGIPARLELHRPAALPDTPPGLVSPSSSAHTPRISEEPAWAPAVVPISPPMSSYDPSNRSDMSTTKDPEEGQRRRDNPNSAPRQQLPSLSSLFGPPHHVRPVLSPLPDRPSPLHSTHSPLDRPHSRSSSYFPNVSPSSQPRSVYEPRLDVVERPTLPSVASQFPGPLRSPNNELEHPHHATRVEPAPTGRWPPVSHPDSRREYVFESRPPTPPFRSVMERIPLPPLNQRLGFESNPTFKRETQMRLEPPNHSPPLTSAVAPEGAPVKDGLGPKIWTGTHFLPRFVKQAEVPGEGLCYFYDDGTHCKTVIDGEPVNAHWGVTKAGKPRKRLAIACLTCREKKIKCDPDYPRCVQCEKFGRVCKFKNAPRGGHNTSPVASPAEHEIPRQLGLHPSTTDYGRPRSASSTPVSPRTTKHSHPSPELLPGLSAKRMRFSYDDYPRHPPPPTSRPATMIPIPEIKKATSNGMPTWQHHDLPRDILCRPWQTDPRPHTRV